MLTSWLRRDILKSLLLVVTMIVYSGLNIVAQNCDTIYGITLNSRVDWIDPVTGNNGEWGTLPGGINAFASNNQLGIFYGSTGKTVYWLDIRDGSSGTLGTFSSISGELQSGGAAYMDGYLYIGSEQNATAQDIYRIRLSADGKSAEPANTAYNMTFGNGATGDYGDFVVFGTPDEEVFYGSTRNRTNNYGEFWRFKTGGSGIDIVKTFTDGSVFQLARTYSDEVMAYSWSGGYLFRIDTANGNLGYVATISSSTYADLGGYFCFQMEQPMTYGENYAVVLPILFNDYSVSYYKGQTYLSWSVLYTEKDGKCVVERSDDGVTWYAIGERPWVSKQIGDQYFSFTDKNPKCGVSYYRVKAIAANEQPNYTAVNSISHLCDGNEDIYIIPNPVKESAVIYAKSEILAIKVVDMMGQIVVELNGCKEHSCALNLETQPKGTYYVNVTTADGSYTKKLVKI